MQTNFYLISPRVQQSERLSYYPAYKPQVQGRSTLKFSGEDAFSLKFSQDDRFKNAIPKYDYEGKLYYYLPEKGYYDTNGHPSYAITGRKYAEVAVYYPDWVLGKLEKKDGIIKIKQSILKESDAILDLGAGEGQFVKALKGAKFTNLTAIDKNFESEHVKKIDISELTDSSYAHQFDHIFSTWSIFTYDESKRFQYECLKKMAAWLKPGGKIYLSPVDKYRIEEFAQEIPGLTVQSGKTEATKSRASDESCVYYVILTKNNE